MSVVGALSKGYGMLRENWRIGLLVAIVLLSTVFLFAPGFTSFGGSGGVAAADRPTNLKYGLELDGGTRIRAPLVGVTAENVTLFVGEEVPQDVRSEVAVRVAGNLSGVDVSDVIVRPDRRRQGSRVLTGTVEVTLDNVTQAELDRALTQAGFPHETDRIRSGVTAETREQTVNVLESKINEAGLSGGSVRVVETIGTSQPFVLVEVPNADQSEVIDLVESKGTVRVVGYYPTQVNGTTVYRNITLITQDQFQRISNAQRGEGGNPPRVPVQIKESETETVQQRFKQANLDQRGGTRCTYQVDRNNTEACILLVSDGKVLDAYGISPSLAKDIRTGDWAKSGGFRLETQNFTEAQRVAVDLQAGALPAPLDIGVNGSGTASSISPAQGERFKQNSLIVGLISVLAVSGVVFIRYGELEVALPMIVTAVAEVYALLGFAALLQFPLDLSVIGGFIAVIGTGVDDLIIIADEVMSEGEVNSRRVFQSRFRKAFWVIGAAAATTLIAMSPLAVLSLGDLRGFAIFTILGVLVGVLITRPAYGDILRALLTDQ